MKFIKTFESYNNRPITVGVTGSIASGKSTVCKMIEEKYGYLVYYSDIEAKKIANTNQGLINEIIDNFGEQSYIDGIYNTKYIAGIVFSDKKELEILNRIFKKYLDQDWENFLNEHRNEKIIFYESALIFEHNIKKKFDYVICVYANLDTIRKRLKKRNNYTDQEIENRLDKLSNQNSKIENSDYNINTENEWNTKLDNIIVDILKN
jgi:dephospho-CoA kinase